MLPIELLGKLEDCKAYNKLQASRLHLTLFFNFDTSGVVAWIHLN